MRGVRISSLELDSSGSIAVEKLADIFEDGEVAGDSYLASSLRKSIAERGPTPLDTIVRRFNNGYFGASWMYKGRVYIKEDSEAPEGARIQEGPRGGRYYETKAGRGRPLGEAPKDWTPQAGERVRIRWAGDQLNGHLARVEELTGVNRLQVWLTITDERGPKLRKVHLVEGDKLVPAPYTRKEKREMKARDILLQEFGTTKRRYDSPEESGINMEVMDAHTELGYDIFDTDAGVELWVKSAPSKDKPWAVTKESATSLGSFIRALPEMSTEAVQALKDEVQTIVFSPVSNPHDRKHSKAMGRAFTSRATFDMGFRIMHIYPAAKDSTPRGLADLLTHEIGHARDDTREKLVDGYNERLRRAWDKIEEEGINMPADPDRMRTIEKAHGIPPHPNAWMNAYGKWMDFDLGAKYPDKIRFWGIFPRSPAGRKKIGRDYMMIGESSWNDLSPVEKVVVGREARKAAPVSAYARKNAREYYAEAYMEYHLGVLNEAHVMYAHFKQMPAIERWVKWGK